MEHQRPVGTTGAPHPGRPDAGRMGHLLLNPSRVCGCVPVVCCAQGCHVWCRSIPFHCRQPTTSTKIKKEKKPKRVKKDFHYEVN